MRTNELIEILKNHESKYSENPIQFISDDGEIYDVEVTEKLYGEFNPRLFFIKAKKEFEDTKEMKKFFLKIGFYVFLSFENSCVKEIRLYKVEPVKDLTYFPKYEDLFGIFAFDNSALMLKKMYEVYKMLESEGDQTYGDR